VEEASDVPPRAIFHFSSPARGWVLEETGQRKMAREHPKFTLGLAIYDAKNAALEMRGDVCGVPGEEKWLILIFICCAHSHNHNLLFYLDFRQEIVKKLNDEKGILPENIKE